MDHQSLLVEGCEMDGVFPVPAVWCEVCPNGDGVTVAVGGELDMSAVPDVAGRLAEAIETGSGTVTVDLAEVTFIDSAGLVVLVTARGRLAGDRRLVVARPSWCVRRLFDLAGVSQLFAVADLDEARP